MGADKKILGCWYLSPELSVPGIIIVLVVIVLGNLKFWDPLIGMIIS